MQKFEKKLGISLCLIKFRKNTITMISDKLMKEALAFETAKMSNMSTSDRVKSSREAKRLILAINDVFKETQDPELMDLMKRLTVKKKKIEKRLMGRPAA